MAKNFKKDPSIRTRKPDPVVLRKVFPTFEEAIESLMKSHEAFYDIIKGETDLFKATLNIVNDFSQYTPNLLACENIYSSLNVASNRLTYRVDKNVSFGWFITYSIVDNTAIIDKVSMQVTIYNMKELKELSLELLGDEWVKVDKVEK